MVGWGVIPDQQLGHRGAHLAQRLHEGCAVVLAAALAHERDELAGGRVAGALHAPAAAPPYAWGSPSVSSVSSVAPAPASSRRALPGCSPSATPATPPARQAATQLCTLVCVQSSVRAIVATGTRSARSSTA